jgi:hypothetical protein
MISEATMPAVDSAAQMGARAGKAFRDTGVPSRNPFLGNPDLIEIARAFDRAYFAASARKA